MRPKATTKDLYAALGATALGGLFLFIALRARWNPQEISPNIEAVLCTGVMGTILALLSPMEFRHALSLSAPVVVIELFACVFAGGPAAGVVGLHLLIVGFIGLAIGLREPRPERAPGHARAAPPDERAAEQHG